MVVIDSSNPLQPKNKECAKHMTQFFELERSTEARAECATRSKTQSKNRDCTVFMLCFSLCPTQPPSPSKPPSTHPSKKCGNAGIRRNTLCSGTTHRTTGTPLPQPWISGKEEHSPRAWKPKMAASALILAAPIQQSSIKKKWGTPWMTDARYASPSTAMVITRMLLKASIQNRKTRSRCSARDGSPF